MLQSDRVQLRRKTNVKACMMGRHPARFGRGGLHPPSKAVSSIVAKHEEGTGVRAILQYVHACWRLRCLKLGSKLLLS
jgi:hypothetical protein